MNHADSDGDLGETKGSDGGDGNDGEAVTKDAAMTADDAEFQML